VIRHVAAPFAGMTQTGSTGLISAAVARHPMPCRFIMGISVRFHKPVVRFRDARDGAGTGHKPRRRR
jgi:hypothetical protein